MEVRNAGKSVVEVRILFVWYTMMSKVCITFWRYNMQNRVLSKGVS